MLLIYFQLKPSESEITTLGNKHLETAQEEAKKLTSVILSVREILIVFVIFLNPYAMNPSDPRFFQIFYRVTQRTMKRLVKLKMTQWYGLLLFLYIITMFMYLVGKNIIVVPIIST